MADLDTAERRKLADQGKALPDGSFPIRNREDLKDGIKRRARELNAEKDLPEDW